MKSKGEWGEYFPSNISPFAYNETVANEYFPLNKDQVLRKGLNWKERDPKEYVSQTFEVFDDINNPVINVSEVPATNCTDGTPNGELLASVDIGGVPTTSGHSFQWFEGTDVTAFAEGLKSQSPESKSTEVKKEKASKDAPVRKKSVRNAVA